MNLVLSDGPPAADVLLIPDFVGDSVGQSQGLVRRCIRCPFLSAKKPTSAKPDGEVLMQSPTADTPIHPGDTLTVVVNHPAASTADAAQGARIYYEVPQGSSDRDVRVSVVDESGEREVFRKSQAPGSKVDIRFQPKGHARARIFVNGVMVEEQPLQ